VVAQTSLVQELQGIVGAEHASPPDEPRVHEPDFMVDGLMPQVIVYPGTYEEIGAVIRYANDNGLAIIPCGHGRMPWLGNIPRRYDIALSVTRLNQIIDYEPADMTVTCQAGTTLGDLHTALSAHNQMLPIGPTPRATSCIGRILARGRSRNLQYGGQRDYTIGMRIVTADGRITRAGGKVVKNVAGYDLCKLYIGSLGSLGVIVEATFKLVPSPQAQECIELEFNSFEDACAFAIELHRQSLSLWETDIRRPMALEDQGCEPRGPLVLSVDLSGPAAAVERSRQEITRLANDTGAPPFDPDHLPKRSGRSPDWANERAPLGAEISVLPSDIPTLILALDAAAPGGWINVSPIDGKAHATWLGAGDDQQLARHVQSAVSALGGTAVISCSTDLKRQIDVFGEPPPSFELMRRIKQQFDPNDTLSPGRFVGRL
jgi:glycolate oxidase FAD binding subunit